MSIAENISSIRETTSSYDCTLVAVSKTKPNEMVLEAYEAGQRIFGENKVQDLCDKQSELPDDIEWHMIGHLQTNKVKFLTPFISLIHGVDSVKLLKEINKQAQKYGREIECLLQVHIAQEDTKFGFDEAEVQTLLSSEEFLAYKNVKVMGLMGMASNTDDEAQVRKEFGSLKVLFDDLKTKESKNAKMQILSMGMSGDYKIALEEGSTMIRVGSSIFGSRNYE